MLKFFNALSRLFTPAKYPSDSATEPAQITQCKVLLIVYDPVMDPATGITLSQKQKWYRTTDLITGFILDMLQVSGGMALFQIVQRVDVNEVPSKVDGFRYTPKT